MGPGNGLRNLRSPVDDEVIWEQGSRTAVRKSDDCCRQSAAHLLRAGVSGLESKGGGEARRTLIRGVDDSSASLGLAVPVSRPPRASGLCRGRLPSLSG